MKGNWWYSAVMNLRTKISEQWIVGMWHHHLYVSSGLILTINCSSSQCLVDILLVLGRNCIRCTHAKLALQTAHPLPGVASLGLHWNKEERSEAGNLFAPISPLLTRWYGWCDYTLPFGSVAAILLAAIWRHCRYCWMAWIIFVCCWVTNSKHSSGYGKVWLWMLGGGGY